MDESKFAQAAGVMRQALDEIKKSPNWTEIVEPKGAVLERFQLIFHPAHIPELTAEEIRPFFYFENNHHWSGLYRHVTQICEDMPALSAALATLLDEKRPIAERLDEVMGSISGLGRATVTAILTVAHPEKYGVLNNVSEAGLVHLGLYPDFERGSTFGARYIRINDVLLALAKAVGVDLWTLDALWWQRSRGDTSPASTVAGPTAAVPISAASPQTFGLERRLHDFLFDNWNHTSLGAEWKIFETPGDPEAGYEYPCAIGRIDILGRHRSAKKWLVIELKRDETSDATVGQALRYMGWVSNHLAEPGDEVHGLIIARSGDDALQYAVSAVPRLKFMTYEVEFRLNPSIPVAAGRGKAETG